MAYRGQPSRRAFVATAQLEALPDDQPAPDSRWDVQGGPETALKVYNLFGTVTVIVPVEVVARRGGLFASQKIESPERPAIASGPRLTIDTGGTFHVRSRPTLK